MKRMTITTMLVLLISCATFAKKVVAEGKSLTAMGDFKIETSDQPLVLNGVTLDTYTVTYSNSDVKLTIAIEKTKKCKRFITISDKLSVQYACYGTHFGVEKLSREYAKAGWKTIESEMNKSSYFHQKIITQGYQDPITCMSLIGAYFPFLIEKENLPA